MAQLGFYLDDTRCTGCRTCEMACKDYKDLAVDRAYRKVFDMEGGAFTEADDGTVTGDVICYHISMACNHCEDPACTKVCPTTAMHKDSDTGIVSVDSEKCIGCGYCHMACPYGATKVDREKGYATKCDGCKDRVAEGKQPICVQSCPLRALQFDEVNKVSNEGEVASIVPLPDPALTHPHFYIKTTDSVNAVKTGDVHVANIAEVE